MNVVSATITTTAENTASSTTRTPAMCSVVPMPANLAAFLLLILGCGAVIFWLVKQLQTVIADHKELRESHHTALAQIIEKQNDTTLKLAVCLDRNSEALRECAFELRRFQEARRCPGPGRCVATSNALVCAIVSVSQLSNGQYYFSGKCL